MQIFCNSSNIYLRVLYKCIIENRYRIHVNIYKKFNDLTHPELKNCKLIINNNSLNKNELDNWNNQLTKKDINVTMLDSSKDNIDMSMSVKKNQFYPSDLDSIHHFIKKNNLEFSKEYKPKSYIQIPIEILNIFEFAPCDIYIYQLSSYNLHYTIRQKIRNIPSKKKYFFVKNNQYSVFFKAFNQKLLENKELLNVDNISSYIKFSYENFAKYNLSSEVVYETNKIIDEIFKEIYDVKKDILNVLEKILNQDSFLSSHSLLTAYLIRTIDPDLTLVDYKNLIISAIFHDFKNSNDDEEKKIFINDPSENFKKHTTDVLSLLKKIQVSNNVVEKIVENHHELPHRAGLLKKQESELTYLDCLFIVCHYFAIKLYLEGIKNKKEIINNMQHIFDEGKFKTVMQKLESNI